MLSGDNAVVIALASRSLDRRRRTWAIFGGASVAICLRIVLTYFVVELLSYPGLKLLSGLLLLWIAFDLLRSGRSEKQIEAAGTIRQAIRTIALADAVMSLDNVVAVAAAAKNSVPLVVFGIALSVPLIVFGSTLILVIIKRFPMLVVAGAVLLGWVAGEITSSDPLLHRLFGAPPQMLDLWMKVVGAALVLALAALMRWHTLRQSTRRDTKSEA